VLHGKTAYLATVHARRMFERSTARGDASRSVDAPISAKIALIGIDRSLDALATMALEDDDAPLELLRGQLRRVLKEVEARFPGGRAVVRQGLDSSG
jgi:hypothetical protein